MSCSVECIVAIYAVPKLLYAISSLTALAAQAQGKNGAKAIEDERVSAHECEKEIVDTFGKKIAVDLVLTNAHGDKIGVRANPGRPGEPPAPLEFVFSNPSSKTAQQTLDKVPTSENHSIA